MTADPAWVTELQKAENDTLRQAGDIPGIMAKYSAQDGTYEYTYDVTTNQLLGVVGGDWVLQLSEAEFTEFKTKHSTPEGLITVTNPATRLFAVTAGKGLTVAERESLRDAFAVRRTVDQSLGLQIVTPKIISEALKEIADTPQKAEEDHYAARQAVLTAIDAGAVETTSTANLQTIATLLGT